MSVSLPPAGPDSQFTKKGAARTTGVRKGWKNLASGESRGLRIGSFTRNLISHISKGFAVGAEEVVVADV